MSDPAHAYELYNKYFKHQDFKGIPESIMNDAISEGMLSKSQLIDGQSYIGHCRNATVAVWHADKNRFTYKREKFNSAFDEDICHPEDDNGFDLFIPVSINDNV